MKIHVVGTHEKRLAEALLMSTRNICFPKDNMIKHQYFRLSGSFLLRKSHRKVDVSGIISLLHKTTYKLLENVSLYMMRT